MENNGVRLRWCVAEAIVAACAAIIVAIIKTKAGGGGGDGPVGDD